MGGREQGPSEEIKREEAITVTTEREIKGLLKIFEKGESCMCFSVDGKVSVIIMANVYHPGHMQDSVLSALHILTHSILTDVVILTLCSK